MLCAEKHVNIVTIITKRMSVMSILACGVIVCFVHFGQGGMTMDSCKDCLHYEVCKECGLAVDWDDMEDGMCRFWADKSLYVKLPCKVGDTVWFETFTKNATINEGLKPHRIDGYRIAMLSQDKQTGLMTKLYDYEFGKHVFLSKAEADAAIKEMS